jgi:large subunit ribosomal protein L13
LNKSKEKVSNPFINSIKGMLPHNRLGKKILTHLKVYAGSEHPHSSQKPIKLEL